MKIGNNQPNRQNNSTKNQKQPAFGAVEVTLTNAMKRNPDLLHRLDDALKSSSKAGEIVIMSAAKLKKGVARLLAKQPRSSSKKMPIQA